MVRGSAAMEKGWDVIPSPVGSYRSLLSVGVMGSELHLKKD